MKKNLLYLGLAFLSGLSSKAIAQEAVTGGNMEDSTKWHVTQITTTPANEAKVTFNYKEHIPAAGQGGAMRVTATGVASSSINVMIWQRVQLKANHHYVLDAAFLDLGGLPDQAYWAQWYVEKDTPQFGMDFSKEANAHAQINTWGGCSTGYANIDITLQTWTCENGALSDTVVVTQDTTYTFGVKMGVYNSAVITYDVVIDNMSLFDLDVPNAVNTATLNKNQILFNNNVLRMANGNKANFQVYNLTGQLVQLANTNELNLSLLPTGVYIVRANKTIVQKIVKR
jgi:hypothetical protein